MTFIVALAAFFKQKKYAEILSRNPEYYLSAKNIDQKADYFRRQPRTEKKKFFFAFLHFAFFGGDYGYPICS